MITSFSLLGEKVGKRADSKERKHRLSFIAYLLTKDEFVNVMSKHGAGREETGVCRRHDSGRHRAQSHKRNGGWSEVLKHHGKDQCLVKVNRSRLVACVTTGWLIEISLSPICGRTAKNT